MGTQVNTTETSYDEFVEAAQVEGSDRLNLAVDAIGETLEAIGAHSATVTVTVEAHGYGGDYAKKSSSIIYELWQSADQLLADQEATGDG